MAVGNFVTHGIGVSAQAAIPYLVRRGLGVPSSPAPTSGGLTTVPGGLQYGTALSLGTGLSSGNGLSAGGQSSPTPPPPGTAGLKFNVSGNSMYLGAI